MNVHTGQRHSVGIHVVHATEHTMIMPSLKTLLPSHKSSHIQNRQSALAAERKTLLGMHVLQ